MNEIPPKEEDNIFNAVVIYLHKVYLSFLAAISRGIQLVRVGIRKRSPWRLNMKKTSFTQLQKTVNRQDSTLSAAMTHPAALSNEQEEANVDSRQQQLKSTLTSAAQSTDAPKALPELLEALKRLDAPQPYEDIEKTFNVSIVIQHLNEMTAVKVPLFLDNNLICEESQGSFVDGHRARISICLAAAQHFLDGDGFGSETDIYAIIEEGIGLHLRHHVNREHALEEHIKGVNGERLRLLKRPLAVLVPNLMEGVDEEHLALMKETPFDIPFVRTVGEGFITFLEMLDRTAKRFGQKACGLIVCHDEPVLVFFPKPGVPYLFDAQGRTHNQETRGAALLRFDDVESLAHYLQKSLYKTKKSHFSMIMLGLGRLPLSE